MARDPKTQPTKPDTSDLPELTHKQLGFVKGLLAGLSASDAYRHAYDCENQPAEQIWRDASILKSNPKVAKWLDRVRQDMLADTAVTIESHTRELKRLAQAAEKAGNYGASAKCVELTGRVNGLYVERIKTDDATLAVAQVLERIAQLQPGTAAALAASMGLELPGSDTETASDQPDSTKPLKSLH